MAQLFRPLLELVQVGPNRSLELHGIARSPLARGICLDVLVQVLVWVALVAVRRQVKQLIAGPSVGSPTAAPGEPGAPNGGPQSKTPCVVPSAPSGAESPKIPR